MNLKIIHITGCDSCCLCSKKHKQKRYGKVKALKGLLTMYCSPNILKRPSIRNSNNHAAFRNVTYQVPLQLIYTFPGQIFARTQVHFTHSSYIYCTYILLNLTCVSTNSQCYLISHVFNILIVLIFLSVYLKYSKL